MPMYPGTPVPTWKEIASIEQQGYRESLITISTHTGTHLDVEAHLYETGKTIDNYGLDSFYGSGLVIDCSQLPAVQTEHLENALTNFRIPDFLLLFTGWDQYWGKAKYFSGYPCLTTSAAKYLTGLPLKGIGIDAVSFDNYDNEELPNHKILLKQGLVLIENLTCLKKLIRKIFTFSCFPLKLTGSDSSLLRACAIIDK
jgi:kynurenine formamidase